MLFRKFALTLLTALLITLLGPVGHAQETTSALRGQIIDSAGKPLSGASILIVHNPTGTRSSQASNSEGVFDARGLRVGGPYTVEVTANGYRTEKYENVFLIVGETARLNASLEEALTEILVSASPVRDAI